MTLDKLLSDREQELMLNPNFITYLRSMRILTDEMKYDLYDSMNPCSCMKETIQKTFFPNERERFAKVFDRMYNGWKYKEEFGR